VRRALPYIRAGALAGLGSGLLALVLELATESAPEPDARLGLVLCGMILSSFVVAGTALSLSLMLLQNLSRVIWPRKEIFLTAILTALVVTPGLFLLVRRLAAGRKAAQVLGPLWVQLSLTLAAAVLIGLLLWIGLRVARWLGQRRHRGVTLVVAAGLLQLAIALILADAMLYRRLYGYLHNLLLVAYLIAGMLALLALALGLRPRAPRRPWPLPGRIGLALALLALVAGGAAGARRVLSRDQRLRFVALEQTTVTANILSMVPLGVGGEAPLFLESASVGQGARHQSYRVADANVVLVTIDALRADHLGVYGYSRPTSPNIDALAARAVRFDRAYCQAPLTCYSIPSLLTGDYLRSTLPLLSKAPPTLARILGARGYTTAAFYNASIFFCDDKRATAYGDSKFGFRYAETALRPASELTDQVLRYLEQFRDGGKRKLFLWVHYFDVHEPYMRHPEHDFGARDMDRYDSEIAFADQAVGRLVASLHQLEGPTIFVLGSDHGEEFKEHGGSYHGSSLYEEQIRVPLIIGVPGLRPRVVQTPAQMVDVAPTVLSLLGIRLPESVRGESLVPELLGHGSPDRTAFAEVHTKKMVRFRGWKLIHDYRRSTFELYDLLTDPTERVNLIGRRPRDAARLKGLLVGWFDRLRALSGKREEDRPEGIDLGRIGDRRSVPMLARLLMDATVQSRWRQEAAQLLGGLQDRDAAEALWVAAGDDDQLVADEAAVALGEIKDRAARFVLPEVVTDPGVEAELRMRAAIALARIDSPLATPALIEALYGDNWEIQNRAAHYLGFVGDRRAFDPLLRMSKRLHLRSRIALALGRIGARFKDRRILPYLLDRVRNDPHAEVRQRALGGVGFLGDKWAIGPLARLLADEPDLTWTPETLSRLGGVGWYWVPGVDFASRRGLKDGWGSCVVNPSMSTDDYLGRSWCAMSRGRSTIQFQIRRKPFAAQVMVRYRSLNPALNGRTLTLRVNGRKLPSLPVREGWHAARIPTPARLWKQGSNTVRFHLSLPGALAKSPPGDLVALDYLVLAARPGPARRKPHL